MLSRKLTLCAGAGLLFALAKPIATSWTATLSPVGGSAVSGTATVDVPDAGMAKPDQAPPAGAYDSAKKAAPAPAPGGESARASITISGAKEGEYPWRVISGKCGSNGPAVGSESAYSPIKVSADGKGTAQANISFKPTPGTDYSVNVQNKDKAVISCGDLQGGGDQMQMPPRDTTAPKP